MNRIMKKNGMSSEQFAKYAPYIHDRVTGPIPGGVSLEVPEGMEKQPLADIGVVDVTCPPFGADATGKQDATDAIRRGVVFARDHQMVLFFPAGTYRISDTIECRQLLTVRGNGRLVGAPNFPCVLVGSADPSQRSVVYLAPKSSGFTDPTKRKIVVHFTNCNYGSDKRDFDRNPLIPQANINYSQIFMDIDIVIGEGNAGAIGIRMQAAEGSSIQNVTIDATYGHTGMQGAAGSGGSHHNITIKGGHVGIDTRGFPPEFSETGTGTQPTPTMTHVTLQGQTEAPLINMSRGPLVAVGWDIDCTALRGPAITTIKTWRSSPFNSGLALIDSVIRFPEGVEESTVIDAEKSFYMQNVYVQHAGRIVGDLAGNPDGWLRIDELAYPIQPEPFREFRMSEPVYIDGRKQLSPHLRQTQDVAPPAELRVRHIWGKSFPSWQSPGAVSVKNAPYNAIGDGQADDTEHFRRLSMRTRSFSCRKGIIG